MEVSKNTQVVRNKGSGAAANPITADQVLAQLAPYAPFNTKTAYSGEPGNMGIVDAWKHKDPGAMQVYAKSAEMGPVFAWAAKVASTDGDYLGRALGQNMDAAIWLRALEREGVISSPSPEWRRAIELATLCLDLGNDGAGRTGFMYVMTGVDGYPGSQSAGSVKMPTGLQARAGMLVGGSGRGLYVDNIFKGPNVAADFAKALANESNKGQSPKTLIPQAKDIGATTKEVAIVESGALVKTQSDRDEFAEALLVTKLADRSRGAVFRSYLAAGGGNTGLDAVMRHPDWKKVVEDSFEKARDARAD